MVWIACNVSSSGDLVLQRKTSERVASFIIASSAHSISVASTPSTPSKLMTSSGRMTIRSLRSRSRLANLRQSSHSTSGFDSPISRHQPCRDWYVHYFTASLCPYRVMGGYPRARSFFWVEHAGYSEQPQREPDRMGREGSPTL